MSASTAILDSHVQMGAHEYVDLIKLNLICTDWNCRKITHPLLKLMMPDRALARNFVDILMMMVILCMALSVRSSDEECANVTGNNVALDCGHSSSQLRSVVVN